MRRTRPSAWRASLRSPPAGPRPICPRAGALRSPRSPAVARATVAERTVSAACVPAWTTSAVAIRSAEAAKWSARRSSSLRSPAARCALPCRAIGRPRATAWEVTVGACVGGVRAQLARERIGGCDGCPLGGCCWPCGDRGGGSPGVEVRKPTLTAGGPAAWRAALAIAVVVAAWAELGGGCREGDEGGCCGCCLHCDCSVKKIWWI